MSGATDFAVQEKTTKQVRSKRVRKVFLKVLLALLIIIAIITAATVIANAICLKIDVDRARSYQDAGCAQLDYEVLDNGYVQINSNDGLNVLDLTDVHIGGGWISVEKDAKAINAVASMITEEKPDLVVVTGDIAFPVPYRSGTLNNKSGAKIFAELMESLGVYWTLAYGNHDTEAYSYYSREDISEFYMNGDYPHCLFQPGPDNVDGSGNQVLNIVNDDGIITRSLILLDSHSYVDGDILGLNWYYDNIHDNQIEWYSSVVDDLKQRNTETAAGLSVEASEKYSQLCQSVPSSVFFHIPMEEYKTAWTEYGQNDYNDTENVKYNYGIPGESGLVVYSGMHPDNMFETMLEKGSTDSVFCGHDHFNNFSLNYKGIDLTYGFSIDYLAYADIDEIGSQRGCTPIKYGPLGEIEYSGENYYQDKYDNEKREEVTLQEMTTQAAPEK